MVPLSLAHRLVTSHGAVRDSWRCLRPDSSLGPADHPAERARRRPIPTAEFNVRENGVTSDSVYNTWRWTKKQRKLLGPGKGPVVVPGHAIDRRGKRLDYVFFGAGDLPGERRGGAGAEGWAVKSAMVGMVGRHPTLGCSLSDHFSVEATFSRVPPQPTRRADPRATDDDPARDRALLNGAHLDLDPPTPDLSSAEPRSRSSPPRDGDPLPRAVYDEILTNIQTYRARELRQRTLLSTHFFAGLALSVGCLVAIWFVPANFAAFILALASTLALASGVVSGLIALLFVGTELRALKEFEWEVRNAREAAATAAGVVVEQGEVKTKGW